MNPGVSKMVAEFESEGGQFGYVIETWLNEHGAELDAFGRGRVDAIDTTEVIRALCRLWLLAEAGRKFLDDLSPERRAEAQGAIAQIQSIIPPGVMQLTLARDFGSRSDREFVVGAIRSLTLIEQAMARSLGR